MVGVIGEYEDGGGGACVVRDVSLEVPPVDMGVPASGGSGLQPERKEGLDDGESADGAVGVLDVEWAMGTPGMEVVMQLRRAGYGGAP